MRLSQELPPQLVVFDVDGTLNGIELWWPDLIRRGLQRFADSLGIELATPDDHAALAVVGEAGRAVWSPFLPPHEQHRWDELRALVLPMEVELLHSGTDYMYPGVRSLLASLRGHGVKLALASNCGAEYMAAMSDGQGLAALTDWQFCLDSPFVNEKADMLRQAMKAAETERAVMVGDRDSDRRAAAAAGCPFVWRVNDLCHLADVDGCWDGDPDQLLALLGLSRIP